MAFKSASRRPTSSSSSTSSKDTKKPANKQPQPQPQPQPPRRSRSVSAVSRSHPGTSNSTSSSSFSDFLIKRDNPLYSSTVSPPDKDNPDCDLDTRGRSLSRNGSKDIGRSLSRIDTGRCRSVSRGPVARAHFLNSEPSSPDGDSASSFSGAVERTSRAVCEQLKSFQECDLGGDASTQIYETVRSEVRRAIASIQNEFESDIRRTNTTAIATTNVTDFPLDMVNPSEVELVMDIQREYAMKLEQSQQRARKLRADLAVEEHRGLELSRILKEVLPYSKMSNVQKPRTGRKSSIERRRMSKTLTKDAMAYFDECVSLSTFDSSDFSSPEDPPISLVGNSATVGDCPSLPRASTSVAVDPCPNSCTSYSLAWGRNKEPSADAISVETEWDGRSQFAFARNHIHNDTFELRDKIGKYVKDFERKMEKSSTLKIDVDEYNLQASAQSLLFETLFFKKKIECGAMLLCGGSHLLL
ncbi:uncharacterized protein LOC126659453 [Mercurialis annua]|uniref:uncharacterized protein LOC126659453 n=1 Tax=Mercurialis annua TaxID=3986 RepID=UPI00215F8C0F|nr:uncharacterized protein LOC126659453 [Mercurialis annua]